VEHAALVDALRREGAALGAVPISDTDVPTCPEWTIVDLVTHVGWVHRWQEAQLRTDDPSQLVSIDRSEQIDLEALADWYHDGLMSLLGTLDATPADKPTPTFVFGPKPATFWARRAAHETAIHRWDAEAAVDRPSPLEPAQAVDVLDEMLEVMAPRRFDATAWEGDDVTIHLHATDVEGEWLVRLGVDGLDVKHAHDKGDAAARGSASDLALLMTGRVPPARLEVFGDSRHLDRWFQSVRF
jgi:uncharacterized protein (TIGR03083 family)